MTITKYKDMTIMNLSENIENFEKDFENCKEVENKVDLKECTNYKMRGNNAEMLIYKDNKIMYSCCYTTYKNKNYITHVYNRSAELVYNYTINYDV